MKFPFGPVFFFFFFVALHQVVMLFWRDFRVNSKVYSNAYSKCVGFFFKKKKAVNDISFHQISRSTSPPHVHWTVIKHETDRGGRHYDDPVWRFSTSGDGVLLILCLRRLLARKNAGLRPVRCWCHGRRASYRNVTVTHESQATGLVRRESETHYRSSLPRSVINREHASRPAVFSGARRHR